MNTVSSVQAGGVPARTRDEAGRKRRCVVSRQSKAREQLIRFALAPDGAAVPDLAESLPGRGFWVSAERAAVDALARRKPRAGARALPACEAGLADRVEALLVSRCIAQLGFARRAGQAVVGRERVRTAAARGELALVLASREEPRGGREIAPDRTYALLGEAELGQAWARSEAALIGIRAGRIAQTLTRDLGRLAGFRESGLHSTPEPGDGANV